MSNGDRRYRVGEDDVDSGGGSGGRSGGRNEEERRDIQSDDGL